MVGDVMPEDNDDDPEDLFQQNHCSRRSRSLEAEPVAQTVRCHLQDKYTKALCVVDVDQASEAISRLRSTKDILSTLPYDIVS